MKFENITPADLDKLRELQPPDWSDIIPDITYYIHARFCYPVKAVADNKIAGIGAAIVYGRTAWLAHIIVQPHFRNKGIGYAIVQHLLEICQAVRVESCLLTATALGKPVYLKAGFRDVSEYVFMNRDNPWTNRPVSSQIYDYREEYLTQIYDMDLNVSGEDRKRLLSDFVSGSKIFLRDDMVLGYCLPQLKEGPIIALNHEAGLELMKIKYQTADKAVIPVENLKAYQFLKDNGFRETATHGTRMVLGPDIIWHPDNIYSRAGGNFV